MKKLKKEDLKKIHEGMKKRMKSGYLREAASSLVPKKYSSLASHSVWHGAKYLMMIMLLSFILMAVISIPSIFSIPGDITSQLDKFDKLNLTIDAEMNSPVMFTESDPQIIIDTTGQTLEMSNEKLLITEDFLMYRPYNSIVKVNTTELQDVTGYKEGLSNLLTFMIVLIMPSILITLYIIFLIKYLVLILLMSLIIFIFTRLIKKDIGIRKALMVSIYASTIMVVLEILFIPFNSAYLLPIAQALGVSFFLLTLLLYLSLAIFASLFAGRKPKKEDKYMEVEEVEWDF